MTWRPVSDPPETADWYPVLLAPVLHERGRMLAYWNGSFWRPLGGGKEEITHWLPWPPDPTEEPSK